MGFAFAIRPCYINPRTTLTEVDGLADEVESVGAEVLVTGINKG